MKIRAFIHTDIGPRRQENQDCALVDDELNAYIVADGMGGHAAGGVASRKAVEVVQQTLRAKQGIIQAFNDAGRGRAARFRR